MRQLEEALLDKGSSITERFFKYGLADIDFNTSYLSVHINPPYSVKEERYPYDGFVN